MDTDEHGYIKKSSLVNLCPSVFIRGQKEIRNLYIRSGTSIPIAASAVASERRA